MVGKIVLRFARSLVLRLLEKLGSLFPDKLYLQFYYYLRTGKELSLKAPQTFTQKLQWLKLYNRKPEYTQMVDKYAVKDLVAGIIGEQYIIPTIGVWDKPEDVSFDSLPDKFVLKTTHGGGGVGIVICKDKLHFDVSATVLKLKKAMKQDLYAVFREWPYKNVQHRIIAEQYLDCRDDILTDYKFYCFNGKPEYCQVILGRTPHKTIDFFNMNWEHREFIGLSPFAVHAKETPHKPEHFEQMKDIASKLSVDIPFVRIDMYETMGNLYFGEMTFFPTSGFGCFSPSYYDFLLGLYLQLPMR